MRKSISLFGAVLTVLVAVGCGPPDETELSQQVQASKSTPILMGQVNPSESTCGADFTNCSEWSAPASSSTAGGCTFVQYQTCSDAHGNQCTNVARAPAAADRCN